MSAPRAGASATCLALAVCATTATRLRVPGSPLGPGELLLAAWMAWSAGSMLARNRVDDREEGRMLRLFWGAAFVLMPAGWLWAAAHAVDANNAAHDFFAYGFIAAFTLILTHREGGDADVLAAARLLPPLLVIPLLVLLLVSLTGATPWAWWAGRYSGLSINPNQVALAMTPAPFLALHAAGRSRGRRRAGYVLLVVGCLVVGIPTLSDGLYMSWAAGSLVFAALAWLRLWRRGSGPYWRAAAGFVFAPAAAIGGALLVGPKIVEAVYGVANTMYYGQGGQGSVRMALYWGAIQAIGRSPLVGWGPGAHTGLHPTRIHQWEAHNGLLDWGAATGAPGVLLFILLHAWIGWRASARPALFAAFVSLVTLGLTHHDLRHPFYWFVMLFAVAAARQAGTEAPPPGEAPAHAS